MSASPRQSLNAKNLGVSGLISVRALRLSPRSLLVATAALALADWLYRLAGDSVVPGGPLDETCHLLTSCSSCGPSGVAFATASSSRRGGVGDHRPDHIPGDLGTDFLTRGTSRPYTHSLLSIVIVLVAAAWWRSRRDVLLGIALGLAIHFGRDMSREFHGRGTGLAGLQARIRALAHRLSDRDGRVRLRGGGQVSIPSAPLTSWRSGAALGRTSRHRRGDGYCRAMRLARLCDDLPSPDAGVEISSLAYDNRLVAEPARCSSACPATPATDTISPPTRSPAVRPRWLSSGR